MRSAAIGGDADSQLRGRPPSSAARGPGCTGHSIGCSDQLGKSPLRYTTSAGQVQPSSVDLEAGEARMCTAQDPSPLGQEPLIGEAAGLRRLSPPGSQPCAPPRPRLQRTLKTAHACHCQLVSTCFACSTGFFGEPPHRPRPQSGPPATSQPSPRSALARRLRTLVFSSRLCTPEPQLQRHKSRLGILTGTEGEDRRHRS